MKRRKAYAMHYEEALWTPSPGCGVCAHLTHIGKQDRSDWKCEAFPGGIPHAIANFKQDHDRPVPGDRGIQYQGRVMVPEGAKVGYYYD